MTQWVRQMQGRPARPDERERWITRTWVHVRASRREAEAQAERDRRQRDLPAQQAGLLDRARRMDAEESTARIRAEAAQLAARRRAEAARWDERMRRERAAEARAAEILCTEYGQPGQRSRPAAVPAAGGGRDITRWAAMGVPLVPADCSFTHPHTGPCQPRRGA